MWSLFMVADGQVCNILTFRQRKPQDKLVLNQASVCLGGVLAASGNVSNKQDMEVTLSLTLTTIILTRIALLNVSSPGLAGAFWELFRPICSHVHSYRVCSHAHMYTGLGTSVTDCNVCVCTLFVLNAPTIMLKSLQNVSK